MSLPEMKYFPKKSSRNFSVRAKGLYRTFMFSSVYRTEITSLFTKSIMRHATKVRPRQLLHYMTRSKDNWNWKNTIQDVLLNVLKQLGSFRPGCSSFPVSLSFFLPFPRLLPKGGGGGGKQRQYVSMELNTLSSDVNRRP